MRVARTSAGRPARLLTALVLLLTALAIPNIRAEAAPDDTFADNFQTSTFSGNSGSLPWTGPWLESGESDGPGAGSIQVGNEPNCEEEPCLLLGRAAGPDATVEREADLSRYAGATLTFNYKIHDHLPGAGIAALKVSDDGGNSWTTLETWQLTTDTGHKVATHDISDFIAPDTRILFAVTGSTDDSHMNVDNLVVAATGALCHLVGDNGGVHQLTSLNLADPDPLAAEITIGNTGSDLRAIAHDPVSGNLYAATTDQLHIVDTSTGTVTTIGPFGSSGPTVFNQIETLAFDPTTGALYASHYRAGDMDLIIQVDLATGSHVANAFGAGIHYVPFDSNRAAQESLLGLAVDAGGQMWGMGWDGNSQEKIHTIDKVTGLAIDVGNSSPVGGLTFDARGIRWGVRPSGRIFEVQAESNSRDVDNLTTYTGIACKIGTSSNLAPTFDQALLDRVDLEGTPITFSAAATDPDGDNLTYAAIGLPDGVSIDSSSGAITGTLTAGSAGTHSVTITVTDDGTPNLQDSDAFTWTVMPAEVTYLVANSGGANGGDDLLTVVDRANSDPATNETNIGTGTGTTNIEAASLQPGTKVLFAVENDQLGTIDVATGIFTPRPSIAGAGNGPTGLVAFDNIEGLAFNPFTGELYGTHRRGNYQEDLLFMLDPATGTHVPGAFVGGDDYTRIESSDGNYHAADLAFDPTSGQAYLLHWTFENRWSLATLDPETGGTATLGRTPDNLVSLAFDGLGRLYSATETGGPETLYELSKMDGSAVSSIVIDNGSNYEAMAIASASSTNQPPVFNQDLTDRTDPEGTPVALLATATDPEGHELIYSATGLPPGVTINPLSGLVSGTIDFTAAGTYSVEITVTDKGIPNLTATDAFTWTVTEFNQPPIFDQDLTDRADPEGTTVSLSAAATDFDAADVLTYGATGLPPGLTIDTGSGLIGGTIDYDAAATSPHAVTITVTDNGSPNKSAPPDTFFWTVNNTNRPPTITNPGAQTTPELAPFSIVVTATDPDGETPTFSDGATLPAWAVLTDNLDGTATISGTPGAGDSGTTTVTITASDGGVPDLSGNAVFDITVTNTNLPPAIVNPGDQSGGEDSPFSLIITASDPDGTTVSFADGGTLPAWANLVDNGDDTATVSGTPGYGDSGVTTVTITASDGSLTDDAVFDITITNTNRPPTVDPVIDQTVAENTALVPVVITAADPDGTVPSLTASGLPGWASFVDNGDGTATITGTPGYDDGATTTVTITASDGLLPATITFDITVTDVNRPPIVDAVADQTVAEGAAMTPLVVTASDLDGTIPSLAATGLPSWASFVDNLDGTASITGTPGYHDATVATVTINAEDGGTPNLAASTTFTITVTDTNRPPVFDQDLADRSNPEGFTVSLSAAATDPDLDEVGYVATGLPPGLAIDPTSGLITGTLTYDAAGVYPVEITANDDGTPNLTATDTFTWTVINTNRAPIADPITDQVVAENDPFTLTVTGSDPDGGTVTFTDSGTLPAWATLTDNGDNTATISGTPGYGDAATTVVVITVSDGVLTDDAQFDLSVTDTNLPPVVDPVPDQSVAENDPFLLTFTASDPDGTTPSFSAAGLPSWATFVDSADGTATVSGTPGFFDAGTSTVTVTATDGDLSDNVLFNLTVSNTNRTPTIDPIADQVLAEGDSLSLSLSASDPDGTTPSVTATGLPVWATLADHGNGTATVSGTPGFGDEGVSTVTIIASDGDLTASKSFEIKVTDVNRAPVLDFIADQLVVEETALAFTAFASDPDDDGLTYTLSGEPTGATIDPTSGAFSWTPQEVHGVGSYAITVTATDDGDPFLSDSQTVTITVAEANRVPTIEAIADQHSVEGASVILTVTATDPDLPANTLTYSATGLPPGLTIDAASGVITGTIGMDAAGIHDVTIAVTDNADSPLLATTTFKWKIDNGNQPPALSPFGKRSVVEGSLLSFTASAADPDGDELRFSLRGAPSGAAINPVSGVFSWTPGEDQGPGTHTLTVLVTDDGTPAAAASETITITVTESNRAPTLDPVDDQASGEGDLISLQLSATDPDLPANNLTYSAVGLPPGLSLDPFTGLISGTIALDETRALPFQIEVTVSDDGDPTMSGTAGFTWEVEPLPEPLTENEAPVISPPRDQFTDEGKTVTLVVTAEDADPVTFAAVGLPPGLEINPDTGFVTGTPGSDAIGKHAVTITVTDRGTPAMQAAASFSWTITDVVAAETKDDIVVALEVFEEAPAADQSDDEEPPLIRRSLVLMGSAAAASTEALRWPVGLLFALLAGFATIGRIGLYPVLWRGERSNGILTFYDSELNFGLIQPDDGGEAVFVHAHAFPRKERTTLEAGVRIRYRVLASDNRSSAWGATMEPSNG